MAASKFLFNAHPAKMAATKYKAKLIAKSGVASPLPNPAPAIVPQVSLLMIVNEYTTSYVENLEFR
jgi:hypothetical protein